jgi:hypothetical protein
MELEPVLLLKEYITLSVENEAPFTVALNLPEPVHVNCDAVKGFNGLILLLDALEGLAV